MVKYEAVMELRTELDQLGKMKGITHAEKGILYLLIQNFKKIIHAVLWCNCSTKTAIKCYGRKSTMGTVRLSYL